MTWGRSLQYTTTSFHSLRYREGSPLTPLTRIVLCAALLLPPLSFAHDVTQQFLPEVDVYHQFADSWGLLFQAKNTKESGESTQVEFGPNLTYDVKRWRTVDSKAPVVSTSIGYRYLPSPSQPPTNRLEPVITFNYEAKDRLLMWDRNRGISTGRKEDSLGAIATA